MHVFYTPDIAGEEYTLNAEESRHCIRVLRLQQGSLIYLVDGRGGFYQAKISRPDPQKTTLNIVDKQTNYGRRNYSLHIAIAPTKQIERFEWFLEKATEIGIDEITPVICSRSERRDIKTERLQKIITSAVKQSIKAYHPQLNPPLKLADFISGQNDGGQNKYIAHCLDTNKLPLKNRYLPGNNCVVLIGPEGDFTAKEIEQATQNNFFAISLGNSRLRTETAALEACFEINFMNR